MGQRTERRGKRRDGGRDEILNAAVGQRKERGGAGREEERDGEMG